MPSKKQRTNERKLKKEEERAKYKHGMQNLVRVFEEGGMDCCVCFDKTIYFDTARDDPFVNYGFACNNAHVVCYKCWVLDPKTYLSQDGPCWVCPMCRQEHCVGKIPNGIQEEGGICTDDDTQYYMKQGEKVPICN